MDVQVKADIKKKFGKHETDTGSVEVQVALLTQRIKELTEHCKTHKKDNHSRRGLTLMVSQRRRLLNYISAKDRPRYQALVQQLGLRK